jgi:transcriptional regulator with GAF, ATPase, and Fis domain
VSANVGADLAAQAEALLKKVQRIGEVNAEKTLGEITETVLQAIEVADHAGITVANRSGEVDTLSATSEYPRLLDAIQARYHEGPCLSAAWEHHVERIDDLSQEKRWPRYCRDALRRTPVRAIMSVQMFSDNQTMGALNFYAERTGVFDADALEMGLLLGTHAALAWNLIRRDEQFRSALATRDVIGQAKGILIERLKIDAVQAFDLLRRLSQESNRPLAEIAKRLVDSAGQ